MPILNKVSLAKTQMPLICYKTCNVDYNPSKASFNFYQTSEKNLPHLFAHWLKKNSTKKLFSLMLKVKQISGKNKKLC